MMRDRRLIRLFRLTYMSTRGLQLPVIQPSDDVESSEDRAIAEHFRNAVDAEVRFGRHDRMLYATDASIYQVEPLGVVLPRRVDELIPILQVAREHHLAMLPRGGGTSLAGQTVNRAIVVDFSKYCRDVLSINLSQGSAEVEPGVVLDQLNQELAVHGLMFGPDVATSTHATIGGMIGNNSAGARSILYGRTVENLLGIEAALVDGRRMSFEAGAVNRDDEVRNLTRACANITMAVASEIRNHFPTTRRHVDGYNLDLLLHQVERNPESLEHVNLASLLCGSEGTLAWTMRAKLKLVTLPKSKGLAVITFGSVREALARLVDILATSPSAVELLDDVVIAMARKNVDCRPDVELLPRPSSGEIGAVFYVEYFGESSGEIADRFDALEKLVSPAPMNRFTHPQAMARAWKLRKSGEPLLHGIPGRRKPVTFIEDTAVDPDKLASFVEEIRACVARHGTTAAYYAHASVGCLHIRPLIDLRDATDVTAMESIAREVTDLVVKFGGALSGEHGDGRVRSQLLRQFYGDRICDAFSQIKSVFDVDGQMNPGIIVDPPPQAMRSNWRLRPDENFAEMPSVDTFFRYEHGFGEAVEQCNGAGVCRKSSGGTMCPSYRATLDERHSTRGRGNALRLSITGQFDDGQESNWSDAETLATLDLCLSCKACKSECPSNVDVARLKSEYLGQGYARGIRPPLASRVVGNVRRLNRFGSAFAPLANLLNRLPGVGHIIRSLADIHAGRSIPSFSPSLYRAFARHDRRRSIPIDATSPVVILLPDCFCTYNESHIGMAAVKVLEAFGYRVIVPSVGCCGRSMISVGLMRQSQRECSASAMQLLRAMNDSNAIAVVGLEPSCVSALTDDWPDMNLTGVPIADLRRISSQTFMIEQFLEERWERHPMKPRVTSDASQSIYLHGHCHQKALWSVDSSAAVLRRLFGEGVLHIIDSGCCGMAGSFGYARHRYDLSMRIGEESLFPAIRSAPVDCHVAAPGTSCRYQIHDGTGRHAIHPIELIARSIGAA